MKEIVVKLPNHNYSQFNALHPIEEQVKPIKQRKSLKERFQFGFMYQHPKIYDFTIWMNDPTELIPKTIAKNIEGNSVLDLGCGTASLRKHLPKTIEYIGVDLNEEFLSHARTTGRGSFYKQDVLSDLTKFKADTVVLSDILHHITPNHQQLIDNALNCARKKVIISACYEKEEGPFKRFSEYISRQILDNDGLNEQRAGAGWLKLSELIEFLQQNGATGFQRVMSHIHCEIQIDGDPIHDEH